MSGDNGPVELPEKLGEMPAVDSTSHPTDLSLAPDLDLSGKLVKMPVGDSTSYLSLAADDIVAVDCEERTLTLASGPISFRGQDLARSYPDCPAEGVAFKFAGAMYRKDALKSMLKLKQTGSRCAESWVPNPALKERLISRHGMLKGGRGDGRFPWYLVSAVYAEFTGVKVNFADELGLRMLEALAALKAGVKELRYEQQILQHINRNGAEVHTPEFRNDKVVKDEPVEIIGEQAIVAAEDVVEEELRSKQVRRKAVKMLLSLEPAGVEDDAALREGGVDSDARPSEEPSTPAGVLELEMARVEDVREEGHTKTPPNGSSAAIGKLEVGSHTHKDEVEVKGQGLEKTVTVEGMDNVPDEGVTTQVETALDEAELKLEKVRGEKDALVETHRQAIARLKEVELRQPELLKQFMKAREEVFRHVATGDKVVVEGLKQAMSCHEVQMAKVAKMHVTRRRLDEKNVSFEERDASNKLQIWELEQAVVDQESNMSALLGTWQASYVTYEEAKLAEGKASLDFVSTLQILADLQRGKDQLQEELHRKEIQVRIGEMEVMDLKHKLRFSQLGLQFGSGLDEASKPSSASLKKRGKNQTGSARKRTKRGGNF